MIDRIQQHLAEIDAGQHELRHRHRYELHAVQLEHLALPAKLADEKFKATMGQPVDVAFLGNNRFDARTGKLIEVGRMRCAVDFDGKRWRFPVGGSAAAGELLEIGGAG